MGIYFFDDDGLLEFNDQANVACGFHSGNPVGLHKTVRDAAEAGLAIGAHLGLPDLAGFGRSEMKLEPGEVRDLITYQGGCTASSGLDPFYVWSWGG